MNENTKKIIDKLSVSFVDPIEYYFFCVVHIIDIRSDKISKLNSIILNAILPIVKKENGVLVRTDNDEVKDDIIFYLPDTKNSHGEPIARALECCLAIISVHNDIDKELLENSYNIGADITTLFLGDYEGKSIPPQIFWTPTNWCQGMSKLGPANSIVIGQDLHGIAQHIPVEKGYRFQKLPDYHYKKQYSYPVYLFSKEESMKK